MSSDLDLVYGALADPTRRTIIERLHQSDATVAELRTMFDISAPAVSKHLRVLESAGLMERSPAGRYRRCRLRHGRLVEARRWLEEQTAFWESTLDSLADHLGEPGRTEPGE
ncbi:MAG: metalloregulator ArsR/SmtB family transcription factor [Ilumatobacter sp.]|uniref:ArsR/SmtB family transcription factor n=1 Tax=Ilumatobacter sp. TaxID=1967498 RepID=UPI002634ACE6|nr:metalloregulator ArsR/SmtB family transcription factor [Ilumatobacter sp.]MDJ0771353.1 metalloregulator ArsR/SmtB family transcription factor [Ilumatobacter sp.]